ncbi:MAG TPA: cupin domain-containing protein [Pyrinomonadaceae bacterium]|nr:cupin domain-containing protein [Pyrinomonadaceae bacterium]
MKAASPKLDLDYLISPHAADFFTNHWQQSALLVKRQDADRFQWLVPASDIDEILAFAATLPADAVEFIGNMRLAESADCSSALNDFFGAGATIRIRGIHEHSAPLRELCEAIEQQLGFPTRVNMYCTPPASRGFNLHFDTHEVLVLQLLGSKRWEVYEPAAGLSENRDVGEAELRATVLDEVIEQGDCLYVPRGFVHRALSLEQPSVHLTVGIHTETEIGDQEKLNETKAAAPADLERLEINTRLEVSGDLRLYLSAAGDMAALNLGEKSLWLPVSFAPLLRFVVEEKRFIPSQLPGNIGEQGKLVFVRQLLEDGFLQIAKR